MFIFSRSWRSTSKHSGCLDIFEIDAAEGRLQRRNDIDHVVDVGRVDLDVEDVDAGEFLEQDGLAFHDRLGGKRADIAKPEHGRTVGDDGDQIGARGIVGGCRRIVADGKAGGGNAGRIGERQVALVAERLGRPGFPACPGADSGGRTAPVRRDLRFPELLDSLPCRRCSCSILTFSFAALFA